MRIVHVSPHLGDSGNGIVSVVVDLAICQANAGHDVTILSEGGAFEGLVNCEGVKTKYLSLRPRNLRHVVNLVRTARTAIRNEPHVIHSHTVKATVVFRALGARRIIATAHNQWSRWSYLMLLADRLIVLSGEGATRIASWAPARLVRRVTVVRNGTVGSKRRPPAHPATLEVPAVVTVAGLYERKGVLDLLAGLEQVATGCHVYVVGEGPLREAIQDAAAKVPARHKVHLVGFSPTPGAYMEAASVFVLASHDEPAGLVLIEAREARAPIVATNVGGIPEMLAGGAGLLVPPRDPVALGRAINEVLTSEDLRESLRENADKDLFRFTVLRVNDETMAVYESVMTDGQVLAAGR